MDRSNPTSASIVSSSSEAPSVTTVTTVTAPSTTPQCTDCQCNGETCIYNVTLGSCQCQCQDSVFGDICSFGQNDTFAHIDTGALPARKANITVEIDISFKDEYNNLSSNESLEFINALERELEALCKEADPQAYKTVQVIKLSKGSVVAESVVQYNYQNNETQIQFLNNELDHVLANILNNTRNLEQISQTFGNQSVLLNGLSFQTPPVTNITDLKPYVNCSRFANYTAVISDGKWQCAGPCKTNPDYCHRHGECFNHISKGPICKCNENSLEQYYGPRCEFYRRGPAFYGALFGSLAAALLLLIIIIVAVIKGRHMDGWKRSSSLNWRLSFDEDFFDFSSAVDHKFGLPGTYTQAPNHARLQ
ncbi:uncharacterized protein LOC142376926 [Odontesthes bonariensis]|uniref:uncharacterized protein LOC142376926 n=1 Tax=Odontesthes bonariensis TaxID=219752 RepID=UPI003F58C08F